MKDDAGSEWCKEVQTTVCDSALSSRRTNTHRPVSFAMCQGGATLQQPTKAPMIAVQQQRSKASPAGLQRVLGMQSRCEHPDSFAAEEHPQVTSTMAPQTTGMHDPTWQVHTSRGGKSGQAADWTNTCAHMRSAHWSKGWERFRPDHTPCRHRLAGLEAHRFAGLVADDNRINATGMSLYMATTSAEV
jgi:hypothetical protein